MKKNWMLRSFVVLMALVICLTAAACGNTPDNNAAGGNANGSGENTDATGEVYAFSHNDVKVTPSELVDPIVQKLGSEYKYHESPSCAYIGMDKCYVYKGFSIYTYPDDKGVDHVLQVVLTDDSVSTPEGLYIGDAAQRVTELYGTDCVEANGSFAYTRGKTSLTIIVKDDAVASIQYVYTDGLF